MSASSSRVGALKHFVSCRIITKFSDSRRALFHIGNNLYSAKLVDLPCIIESQKTLDGKQMFKVADICQVLAYAFTCLQNLDIVSVDASGRGQNAQ
jgi:TATA-binding protein-associated factor Taf7